MRFGNVKIIENNVIFFYGKNKMFNFVSVLKMSKENK